MTPIKLTRAEARAILLASGNITDEPQKDQRAFFGSAATMRAAWRAEDKIQRAMGAS
jgi:hypothetical protein